MHIVWESLQKKKINTPIEKISLVYSQERKYDFQDADYLVSYFEVNYTEIML